MTRFAYYAQNGVGGVRGEALTALTGLPSWARLIVMVLAVPGIVLVALSLVVLATSVAALLVLTVPAYSLLRSLTGGTARAANTPINRPPARRVEATVVGPNSTHEPHA